MADIVIRCEKCSREKKVSEYATTESVKCADTACPLEVPARIEKSSLRVRNPNGLEPEVLNGRAKPAAPQEPPPLPGEAAVDGRTMLEDVYKLRGKPKKTYAGVAWLLFLVVFGVLLWMQTVVQNDPAFASTYNWTRGIIGGLIYLLVIVVAFEDHIWQGLLAMLFPPYCFYYALARLDSYVLRNLFFAVALAFLAELYFIPKRAVVTHAQAGVSGMIRHMEGLIQRAGEAPTFN